MGRKSREIESGLIYHIINRGNDKSYIFEENQDKIKFIECLSKAKEKYNYKLLSYVVMDNHYHLLIQTTEDGTISQIMHHIQCGYSRYYKNTYSFVGHVFQGRYKDSVVDTEAYLLQVSKYIHLNPYNAGIVKVPGSYKYNSLKYILNNEDNNLADSEIILGLISKNYNLAIEVYKQFIFNEIDKYREKINLDINEVTKDYEFIS